MLYFQAPCRRPFWLQRVWTFLADRCLVPVRGPRLIGWGSSLASLAVFAACSAALGALSFVAGVPLPLALALGPVGATALGLVLGRLYGRYRAPGFPPSGGDPSRDREPRRPLTPTGGISDRLEL